MNKLLLIALAAILIGAAPAPRRHSRQGGALRFVDLTAEFDRAWTKTKNVPDDRRVEAFEAEFNKVLPGFYEAKRVSDFIAPQHYREMILKGLKEYPEHRAGIRR